MNMTPITASDAIAIYAKAVEKKNLMLTYLWRKTYATKLDKMIRRQAELGYTSVELEYATWMPMVNFIVGLGYRVTHGRVDENTHYLEVSWG